MTSLLYLHIVHLALRILGGIALLYLVAAVWLLIEFCRTPKDPPNIYGA